MLLTYISIKVKKFINSLTIVSETNLHQISFRESKHNKNDGILCVP